MRSSVWLTRGTALLFHRSGRQPTWGQFVHGAPVVRKRRDPKPRLRPAANGEYRSPRSNASSATACPWFRARCRLRPSLKKIQSPWPRSPARLSPRKTVWPSPEAPSKNVRLIARSRKTKTSSANASASVRRLRPWSVSKANTQLATQRRAQWMQKWRQYARDAVPYGARNEVELEVHTRGGRGTRRASCLRSGRDNAPPG